MASKAAFHPYGVTIPTSNGDVILNAGNNMTILPQGNLITFAATSLSQVTVLTGDVTGSGNGTISTTIGAHKVTNDKMATSTANTLAGYDNSGNFNDVAIGAGLSLSAGILSASAVTSHWNEVTTTTQALSVNNGYVMNNASQVVGTLPATAVFGSEIRVVGKGAGGWKIAQNAGQTIHFDSVNTTTGVTGFISSQNFFDAVELLCITANTDWLVISSIGNLTVL